MLPAILLHGFFDFNLFVSGAFQFMYPSAALGLEVTSVIISIAITVGGTIYAYRSFKDVQTRFDNGWQHVAAGGVEEIGEQAL